MRPRVVFSGVLCGYVLGDGLKVERRDGFRILGFRPTQDEAIARIPQYRTRLSSYIGRVLY
jgi:hypothetical protein